VALEVLGVRGREIDCRVLDGGEIGGRKNVNVVGVKTRLPALNDRDKDDLRFGAERGVDYIAASFIRKAADVTAIQRFLAGLGSDIPVIARSREGRPGTRGIVRWPPASWCAGDLG
jgi:pyruvate kinase